MAMAPEARTGGTVDPDVSQARANLFNSLAARDELIGKVVFSSATQPQINGAHPFHASVESQTHWANAIDIVGVKRTAERLSVVETEPITNTLTPFFENGTPKLLDKISSALRGVARPVLVTQTAFGGAAGAVAVVPVSIDVAAHYQMANRPAQVETIVFDQASPSIAPSAGPFVEPSFEPSPIPSVEPSLDPNASPEPVDPCVTEPVPAAGEPEGEPLAAIGGGALADNTNTEPDQDASPAPLTSPEDKTTADAGTDTGLPPTDTDGDGVIDGDVDGDGDVDEDDGETAAVDPCDPKPLPALSEILTNIVNQTDDEINNPSNDEMKNEFVDIWGKYGEYLTGYIDPAFYDGEKLEKKRLMNRLKTLLNNDNDRHEREAVAAGTIALLLSIDEKVSRDPDLKTIQHEMRVNLRKASDMVWDYALENIPLKRGELKTQMEYDIKDILSYYLENFGIEL